MSVDDDLAQATSQSLSMGSAIVATLDTSSLSEVLPQKLHPALYNNFLSDAPMGQLNISNNSSNTSGSEQKSSDICNKFSASCSVGGGVPGFPDFPHFWQGESSAGRPNKTIHFDKRRRYGQKWKINNASTKQQQQQRQISRKSVNVHGTTTKRVGMGKEIKKRLRVDRRRRRMEQIVKLQERRRRKRDMGDICKGVASIKCR